MRPTLPALGAALALILPAGTQAQSPSFSAPGAACLAAAGVAEQRWQLPQGILAAIGEIESGIADPATGTPQPWPWSANVAGLDYVFQSAAEAATVVGFFLERGVASIDVGCFQVNLRQHPKAFGSPAAGFDAQTNADYAARFLRSLYERSGSWVWAIGAYHSADPALGTPYRARVLRAWFSRRAPAFAQGAVPIPVYTPATLPAALRAVLRPHLRSLN